MASDHVREQAMADERQAETRTILEREMRARAECEDYATELQERLRLERIKIDILLEAVPEITVTGERTVEETAPGFTAEDAALADLISGDQFRASIYAFNLIQKRAKRPAGAPDSSLARPITKVGVIGAGLMATQFALLQSELQGQGEHVDVSVQEVVTATMVGSQSAYAWAGAVGGRRPPGGGGLGTVLPCKDGYFVAQASWRGGPRAWETVAAFFGRPELLEPRFAEPAQRIENAEAFERVLVEATRERTMAEMFRSASVTAAVDTETVRFSVPS